MTPLIMSSLDTDAANTITTTTTASSSAVSALHIIQAIEKEHNDLLASARVGCEEAYQARQNAARIRRLYGLQDEDSVRVKQYKGSPLSSDGLSPGVGGWKDGGVGEDVIGSSGGKLEFKKCKRSHAEEVLILRTKITEIQEQHSHEIEKRVSVEKDLLKQVNELQEALNIMCTSACDSQISADEENDQKWKEEIETEIDSLKEQLLKEKERADLAEVDAAEAIELTEACVVEKEKVEEELQQAWAEVERLRYSLHLNTNEECDVGDNVESENISEMGCDPAIKEVKDILTEKLPFIDRSGNTKMMKVTVPAENKEVVQTDLLVGVEVESINNDDGRDNVAQASFDKFAEEEKDVSIKMSQCVDDVQTKQTSELNEIEKEAGDHENIPPSSIVIQPLPEKEKEINVNVIPSPVAMPPPPKRLPKIIDVDRFVTEDSVIGHSFLVEDDVSACRMYQGGGVESGPSSPLHQRKIWTDDIDTNEKNLMSPLSVTTQSTSRSLRSRPGRAMVKNGRDILKNIKRINVKN